MSIDVELPNIGEGVEEADVAEILVSVGDEIEVNQTIMELETEKAVVEVPSTYAGTVEKILVSTGDTVRVGAAILTLSGEGDGQTKQDSGQNRTGKKEAKASQQKSETSSEEAAERDTETSGESKPAAQTQPDDDSAEIVEGEVEFELPPLGEGIDSADIAALLVSEGDVIEADDPVMELETEKAVVELPCPHAGKIKKLLVSEGETVEVGKALLTIETTSKVGGKKSETAPKKDKAAPKEQPTAESKQQPAKEKEQASGQRSAAAAERQPAPATSGNGQGVPVPAAPSTRRLARQLGVDLRQVQGSGRGGRITQDDVQAFVRDQLQSLSVPARMASTSVATGGGLAPPPLPDFSRFGPVERERMNKIARTAAENLTVSWNVIPHVTQHDRIDITDLEAARKRFGQGLGKNGPKVTMTAIVMKALAKCLQAFPKFNSSLDPETHEIVFKRYYHIGCAVDTPNGLLVPVVRDCDKISILDIAQTIGDLAAKARDRKLPVEDMQGATCTVTNLGGIGGVGFTPIVNYPEVCILGMSRGQQELRMIDGQVQQRLILPLSLSYDHRVINGADAARFIVSLGNLLSDPFQLLTTV